jgi:hypothetical protein
MDEYIIKGGMKVSYINELFRCRASLSRLVVTHLNLGLAYYRCTTLLTPDQ